MVSEAIGDDGNFKNTHFCKGLELAHISIAFRVAHDLDPAAKLYIHDYNLEDNTFGQHKSMLEYVNR